MDGENCIVLLSSNFSCCNAQNESLYRLLHSFTFKQLKKQLGLRIDYCFFFASNLLTLWRSNKIDHYYNKFWKTFELVTALTLQTKIVFLKMLDEYFNTSDTNFCSENAFPKSNLLPYNLIILKPYSDTSEDTVLLSIFHIILKSRKL